MINLFLTVSFRNFVNFININRKRFFLLQLGTFLCSPYPRLLVNEHDGIYLTFKWVHALRLQYLKHDRSYLSVNPGINITNGEEVAVKLESVKARHPQLLYESKLYKILQVQRYIKWTQFIWKKGYLDWMERLGKHGKV